MQTHVHWWCHPTISSSVTLLSSCPQSFPGSRSFPMNWHFASGGQNIRVSASASVLLMNIQGLFPLGLTGLISLLSKGLSRVFSKSKCLWGTCWSILDKLCPPQHIFGATNTTVLEKAEEPEIKLPSCTGSWKKEESSRKTSTSAFLTMPKPLTVWITINCENSERDGNTTPPDLPLEKPVCRSGSNS